MSKRIRCTEEFKKRCRFIGHRSRAFCSLHFPQTGCEYQITVRLNENLSQQNGAQIFEHL